MSELVPMLETLVADVRSGRSAGLCAVVGTKGSTPQAPGAAMLVRADMSTVGTLGGGCVEAEVRKRAFELLGRGESGLLDFVLDHDYGWEDGLICGGKMTIGVTPVVAQNLGPYEQALALTRQRRPAWLPVMVRHEGRSRKYRIHLEVPPTLLIAGAGHVGQAVANLAVGLDFHVVVIDDRADQVSAERFDSAVELRTADIATGLREYPIDAGCYVVIVTRGHRHDHQALEAVIRREAAYIGLIGSKRKARMILKDLADEGVRADLVQRVHTPIGLDIGAVTVPEIAVSIVGQLVQCRRQEGGRLVEGPL
ncbi:MAG: XdhC family protein [Phycisphaerae bacterium]